MLPATPQQTLADTIPHPDEVRREIGALSERLALLRKLLTVAHRKERAKQISLRQPEAART